MSQAVRPDALLFSSGERAAQLNTSGCLCRSRAESSEWRLHSRAQMWLALAMSKRRPLVAMRFPRRSLATP